MVGRDRTELEKNKVDGLIDRPTDQQKCGSSSPWLIFKTEQSMSYAMPPAFFSLRIPKKQRKQTLADELMADAKFVEYGSAKMEERKKFDEDRKKRMRQKKHLQRMTAKKKGKK